MAEPEFSDDPVVIWEPRSRPQHALLTCPVFEVFFGGSRGSLKTDSMIGDWISHANLYGRDAAGLMVRRTREQLKSTIERAKQVMVPLGFKFRNNDHECRSPEGALLTFAYLDKDADAENYQGWSLTRVYIEEIGNFPRKEPVMKLMATLRSSAGVPCGFRATGNPGGPGHGWVKERYITPAPAGWVVLREDYANPFTGEVTTKERVFIPGRITDHNLLGADYIASLQMSGNEQLVRAWLEGDWDVIVGAYFDCWSAARHVIRPFPLPRHWLRFRSFDWGFSAPFHVGWWAHASEDHWHPDGRTIPKGALLMFREWYGASAPNEGLKMTAEDVARGILARERDDPKAENGRAVSYAVADPSIFAQSGGPSIAERMAAEGCPWDHADNTRVAELGHGGGWNAVYQRLKGIGDGDRPPPMLYFFSTCTEVIRTLPVMQHDERRPEDIDSDGEDHAADSVRYACLSRPWTREAPKAAEPMRGIESVTLDRLWKDREKGLR